MDFALILKEAGPFTAPLCAAVGLALRWLLADRKELIAALSLSQQRERDLSEKRTQELRDSAVALGESAQVIEAALSQHDRRLQEVLRRCEFSK